MEFDKEIIALRSEQLTKPLILAGYEIKKVADFRYLYKDDKLIGQYALLWDTEGLKETHWTLKVVTKNKVIDIRLLNESEMGRFYTFNFYDKEENSNLENTPIDELCLKVNKDYILHLAVDKGFLRFNYKEPKGVKVNFTYSRMTTERYAEVTGEQNVIVDLSGLRLERQFEERFNAKDKVLELASSYVMYAENYCETGALSNAVFFKYEAENDDNLEFASKFMATDYIKSIVLSNFKEMEDSLPGITKMLTNNYRVIGDLIHTLNKSNETILDLKADEEDSNELLKKEIKTLGKALLRMQE